VEKPDSEKRHHSQHSSSDNEDNQTDKNDQKIWNSITANYEMIEGAQLSNSFIILKVLDEIDKPLNAGQISEIISKRTKGQVFKVAGALRDSLEHRLRREGFVRGVDTPSQSGTKKRIMVTRYSITPRGRKLLQAWIAFISACNYR
jgi:DNA-binding PadR family transcriptional regulator